MRISILTSMIAAGALAGSAFAGDYEHEAWPVANDGNGIYSFTEAGGSQAVPLCTGFYAADIKAMDEHGTTDGYGQIVRSHANAMLDAYKTRFSGDAAALEALTSDMTWHFGNAAQYGSFQELKDSANMACERYALESQLITIDYLNGFNDKLLNAL